MQSNAGRGINAVADLAAFLQKAAQDPRNAVDTLSRAYPAELLGAVPVGAHFSAPNRSEALLSNPGAILNYSQARIVGFRNTFAIPRAATDAVIAMVSDSKFDARVKFGLCDRHKVREEVGTEASQRIPWGNISVLNMHEEMDGKQDVRLFW